MLATNKENYQFFNSAIVQVGLCLLHTILPYCDSMAQLQAVPFDFFCRIL